MTDSEYGRLRNIYRETLDEYERALGAGADAAAEEIFARGSEIFDRMRVLAPPDEVFADDEHEVHAFSRAVGANAAAEAKRVYDSMRSEQQARVDALDVTAPGSVKIWLRSR